MLFFARLLLIGRFSVSVLVSQHKNLELSNAKYNICERASDLKIVIFPSSDKCLMRQSCIRL